MNFPYLQARGAACSERGCSDGIRLDTSNGTDTASKSSPPESAMDICHPRPSSLTCVSSYSPVPLANIEDLRKWLLAAFHVRTLARQEKAEVLKRNAADCGVCSLQSFALFDRDSCSWKTPQLSLLGGLEKFSETWPRWGLMHDGECWEQGTSAEIATETEYGLWPAPRASDPLCVKFKRASIVKVIERPNRPLDLRLPYFLNLAGVPLSQYPIAFEWTMGWPQGWTDLPQLETDKFRQWLGAHGRY